MKTIIMTILAVLSMLAGINAYAASDPATPGTTSQGSANISLTLPKLVQITGMEDLAFGTYDGAGAETVGASVCIYSNVVGGEYSVDAAGSGTASAFTVVHGTDNTKTIPYVVTFNDEDVAETGTQIGTKGGAPAQITDQTGVDNEAGCTTNGDNAWYGVTFTQADMLAVPNGSYTGTLTLTITPE